MPPPSTIVLMSGKTPRGAGLFHVEAVGGRDALHHEQERAAASDRLRRAFERHRSRAGLRAPEQQRPVADVDRVVEQLVRRRGTSRPGSRRRAGTCRLGRGPGSSRGPRPRPRSAARSWPCRSRRRTATRSPSPPSRPASCRRPAPRGTGSKPCRVSGTGSPTEIRSAAVAAAAPPSRTAARNAVERRRTRRTRARSASMSRRAASRRCSRSSLIALMPRPPAPLRARSAAARARAARATRAPGPSAR